MEQGNAMATKGVVLGDEIAIEFDDHRVDMRGVTIDREGFGGEGRTVFRVLDEEERGAQFPVSFLLIADQYFCDSFFVTEPLNDSLELLLLCFESVAFLF